MEHRWGLRHLLDLSVRLRGGGRTVALARIRDASLSGAYLETAASLPLLGRVWVEMESGRRLPNENGLIAGYVVRADRSGYGLEWCEFAPGPIVALMERPRMAGDCETPLHRIPRRRKIESQALLPAPDWQSRCSTGHESSSSAAALRDLRPSASCDRQPSTFC